MHSVVAALIWLRFYDGQGLCLFCKRLERGKFLWPQAKDGSVALMAASIPCCSKGLAGTGADLDTSVHKRFRRTAPTNSLGCPGAA